MSKRRAIAMSIIVGLTVAFTSSLRAEVRTDEKSHFEFSGALGRIVNFFGGKAAREGVVTTVAVKGDREARITEETEQIVDLSEEKVYDLDLKKKVYKTTTFAELRRRLDEAQQKAQENAQRAQGKGDKQGAAPSDQQEPQVEVDFDLKNTGQKRTINGFDASEEVMTITVRQKGKTLEQGGGLVLTGDLWITPRIEAMKELQDFQARDAQKLSGGTMLAGVQADQMATVMAMYPMMKQAIGRMNVEGNRVQGTTILSTLTFDAVKSEDQVAQEAAQQSQDDTKGKMPTSVGSLMSGLAKRAAAKKAGSGDDANKARATIMTGTHEVLKVATSVSPEDLAIPAGFKESK